MNKQQRNIIIVLINYLLLAGFLSLGGYLLVNYPENEALGGMILGLTGIVLGIIMPYHLKRIKVVEYNFFPPKMKPTKSIILTIIFTAILLFIYPSGILGNKSTFTVLNSPPSFMPVVFTFLFLLFSATIYTLLFWGVILHIFKNKFGTIIGIIVTGFLFSIYHFSEFAFTPITFDFLLLMFISGCICSVFTIISNSVFPVLIAQQFGQFVYFLSLEDNPFSGSVGVIFNYILLLICFAVYMLISRKLKKT